MQVLTAGFLVADIIAADLPKLADEGELLFAPKGIQLSIGGHPANVAIDLRQLGIPPKEVGLIGAIGRDMFGDFIRDTLESHEIVARLQVVENIGTTKNIIMVVKGEDRRFHLDLGASWHLDPGMVEAFLKEARPDVFYVATGIVRKLDERLPQVLKTAKEIGCLSFVDIVRPYMKDWDFVIPSFRFTDIFHCNDHEAIQITGEKQLIESLNFIVKAGASTVFVTTGQGGATAMTSEGGFIRQPALRVTAIDPTGAGDAFCAGILRELIRRRVMKDPKEGLSLSRLPEILLYGQAAGAACVTAIGTTTNVTKEAVQQLMDRQGKSILKATESRQLR